MTGWIVKVRRRLADWLSPPTVVALPDRKRQQTQRPKRPPYCNLGSGTRLEILAALSVRPMTRLELNTALNVTTGTHLTQMMDRGEIRRRPGSWPYVYEVVHFVPTDEEAAYLAGRDVPTEAR